jgi:putative ABC transport system permease protein
MLKNYLKVAVRNLMRNKTYSAINIFGLALGVACCLLLTLYIRDEMSYDKHHGRTEDIYRIVTNFKTDNGFRKSPAVSPPIAMTLKNEIPEVEAAVRVLRSFEESLFRYKDNLFYESEGFLADSTLFNIFNYNLTEGDPKHALVETNSVVLSQILAEKLFGRESALDKIVSIAQGDSPIEYKVTGVFKQTPNTIIKASFFTSMSSQGLGEFVSSEMQWAGQNFVPSYLKLVPGHNKADVEKKMNDVLQKHGAEAMKELSIYKTLSLELIKDIYLKSDVGQSPRIKYLYVVASIAAFILLIACINFMNLSTAKATKRAAEIGIRKTLGAVRSSLVRQILGEAMVIVVISIIMSLLIVWWVLPYFNELVSKSISLDSENMLQFIVASVIITIVTGLVAGSYPAFYLSSFEPAQVLKGKVSMRGASGKLRQALVVFQFMIAIALVCSIFIISNQIKFMMEKDLGFDTQAKIVLPIRTDEAEDQYDVLKNVLEKSSFINAVSGTGFVPGSDIYNDTKFYRDGGNMDKAVYIRRNNVDVGYMKLLNMKLISGRDFTDNRVMESDRKIILNRKAATELGFTPEEIVGQNLHRDWQGQKQDFTVIGVMEDFNQTSLHDAIQPTLFEMADSTKRYSYMIASLSTPDFRQVVASIEQTWKALIHGTPFEYSFLDQNLQRQYDEDRMVSNIITSFGLIAMIICALGLYGLSSYLAERRFKEIGIRKVMGASIPQLVTMMSAEFLKLVLIAFVIAVPLAWYGMDKWLKTFEYKTPIEWFVFAWAGIVALAIALITVSFESIKSAMGNPVQSLRSE